MYKSWIYIGCWLWSKVFCVQQQMLIAYHVGRYTEDLLAFLSKKCCSSIYNFGDSNVVFLDMSKKFKRVGHDASLSKLIAVGRLDCVWRVRNTFIGTMAPFFPLHHISFFLMTFFVRHEIVFILLRIAVAFITYFHLTVGQTFRKSRAWGKTWLNFRLSCKVRIKIPSASTGSTPTRARPSVFC